jgi:signal-transduction protein with cAMP-binding, CBS, and nucleotidyltransferase domain
MPETIVSVKEMMSKPALTIEHNKTARLAAMVMKKNRKGFLVVTKKGTPIGVLSDSDLINKIIVKKQDAAKTKVKDIMATPLITIGPNADAMAAVEKMKKSNIHRLPVVEKGRPVGVLSLTDVARASPDMYHLLEYRQEMKRTPIEIRESHTSGICESCANYSERLTHVVDGRWLCESCQDELEE